MAHPFAYHFFYLYVGLGTMIQTSQTAGVLNETTF